jgi:nucleotide-binding universal stress UspA family protein
MALRRPAHRAFRTILCPVDFSASSRAALRYGAALARHSRGSLVVLFVNDPLLVAAAAAAYDSRALATTTDRELRRFVKRALGKGPDTPSITFTTAVGKPAHEIVKVARQLHCDVIVMGTQGLSGPSKWFFGSVTQGVMRRTGVPVLAISPHCRGAKALGTGARTWPGPHIVAPIELGEHAEADATQAADIARGFGSKLVLFHVVAAGLPPPWYGPDVRAGKRREQAEAERRLETIGRRLPHVVEAGRVAVGNPALVISALAEDRQFNMMLLTLRKRRGLLGSPAGSIAYHVLCHATMPVLALPPRAAAQRRRPEFIGKSLRASMDRALARRDRVEMKAVEGVLSFVRRDASALRAR